MTACRTRPSGGTCADRWAGLRTARGGRKRRRWSYRVVGGRSTRVRLKLDDLVRASGLRRFEVTRELRLRGIKVLPSGMERAAPAISTLGYFLCPAREVQGRCIADSSSASERTPGTSRVFLHLRTHFLTGRPSCERTKWYPFGTRVVGYANYLPLKAPERGFLRADDGTRTHDLLHGKQTL